MNIFSQLRALVLLRRGVRALESLASSQSTLAKAILAKERRIAEKLERKKNPKRMEFGQIDTKLVEENWQAARKRDTVERG